MSDLPVAEVAGEDLVSSGGASRRPRRQRGRDSLMALAFLAPAVLIFAVFSYYPLYRLFWYATHRQPRFRNKEATWVGFGQLWDTLTSRDFTSGLLHSFQFMVYTVPLGLILGVLLAVAAHRRLAGIKIFQTIFSSTVATSVAVASVVFFTLVNPEVGYFKDVSWLSLSNPQSAMFAVALTTVWQNLGLTFIIVLAALQAVPDEMNEAATLDGFSATKRFFRITVPLISPALLFLAVVLVVSALQAYAQIEFLTGGGPGDATETLLYKIADPKGVRGLDVRSGLSIGLFALTAIVAAVQYSLLSKRVHYGD
ncbi:MAG: sugar ABC transporter permease [Actinobacteria bacterium]|nr:sugar ABC transporter permease [Actinomycetota bacterium]